MPAVTVYSDFGPKKIKSVTVSTFVSFYMSCVMGLDAMILVVFNIEFQASFFTLYFDHLLGLPGGDSGKEPSCQHKRQETPVQPRMGSSRGGGHSSPLQCSCLENPMDRGAWRATVHSCKELDTTET